MPSNKLVKVANGMQPEDLLQHVALENTVKSDIGIFMFFAVSLPI